MNSNFLSYHKRDYTDNNHASMRNHTSINEQIDKCQDETLAIQDSISTDDMDKDLASPSSLATEEIKLEQLNDDHADRNRRNDVICNLTMVLEAVATQGRLCHNENLYGNADVSETRESFFEMTSSFLQSVRDLNVHNHDRSEVDTLRDTIAAHLENCSTWRREVGMDGADLERCKRVLGEALLILDEKYTILEKPHVPRIPCESDFGFIRVLSRGTFGQVLLAKTMYPRETYCAIKVMSKRRLLNSRMGKCVIRERKVMAKTNRYPHFYPRLLSSFQDDERLFLVMEYVEGGDCLMLLTAMGTIPEYLVRHYVAETCLAVNHLHMNGVVHRDIKVDNLLLTASGHVKLGDFGLARRLPRASSRLAVEEDGQVSPLSSGGTSWLSNSTKSLRKASLDNCDDDDDIDSFQPHNPELNLLYTIVGNFCYQSPEMVLGGGYNEGADWWAVGILTHHMLSGLTPFEDPTNMEKTMENLLLSKRNPTALPPCLSLECLDFISKLLVFDSDNRMGGYRSNEQAIRHSFLNGVDLESIHSKPGPFVPTLNLKICSWLKPGLQGTFHRLDELVPDKSLDPDGEEDDDDEDQSESESESSQDLCCFDDFSYVWSN